MYIKLDYFYFSAFDIEVKAIESIFESIFDSFLGTNMIRVKRKLPSFRKILVLKIVLLCAIEKQFAGRMLKNTVLYSHMNLVISNW